MNQGTWKRFWTWCQSTLGAGWIHLSTYNIMNVYGLEHVEAASRERPLLLVANHRSFFDMYAVSTVLFYRTSWTKRLFFPVRGRFFYQSPLGLLVNLIMGWWSMYPISSRLRYSLSLRLQGPATSSASIPKERAIRATIRTLTCVRSQG
jgi:1-acyl-sn-glycerol-3-phosphate acyltransferase